MSAAAGTGRSMTHRGGPAGSALATAIPASWRCCICGAEGRCMSAGGHEPYARQPLPTPPEAVTLGGIRSAVSER